MGSSKEIIKRLDCASAQSRLDDETRALCLRLVRDGTDAQGLRAIAVLSCAGERTPSLPATIRSGTWPGLPKSEAELRALLRVVENDSGLLASFMSAIISNRGPSEKTRYKLFQEYVDRQQGESSIIPSLPI